MRQFIILAALLAFLASCTESESPTEVPHTATVETSAIITATPPPAITTPSADQNTAPPSPTSRPTASATASEIASPTPSPPTPTSEPLMAATEIQLEPVAQGVFNQPVFLTHAGDSRLFIVEQAGAVRIIEAGQVLPDPFLDIRDRVGSGAFEQGLLSIAFDPGFQQNGRFFAYYTDANGDVILSRFNVDNAQPDSADESSESILMTIPQPHSNHNGGQLQFGPDGMLYMGIGDGGSFNDPAGNGQNPGTPFGTILRIDVSDPQQPYSIPDSNPFWTDETAVKEIWSWGLRNPWRFSFDRLTGDLYIADVGERQWEEVNFQAAGTQGGDNYGWSLFEGNQCFQGACDPNGLQFPIFEYDHAQGCSITGGYIYRGQNYPALRGNYFLADYCSGFIWRLFPQDGTFAPDLLLDSDYLISSFGEDVVGELYVLDHAGGSVYQITSP